MVLCIIGFGYLESGFCTETCELVGMLCWRAVLVCCSW